MAAVHLGGQSPLQIQVWLAYQLGFKAAKWDRGTFIINDINVTPGPFPD